MKSSTLPILFVDLVPDDILQIALESDLLKMLGEECYAYIIN